MGKSCLQLQKLCLDWVWDFFFFVFLFLGELHENVVGGKKKKSGFPSLHICPPGIPARGEKGKGWRSRSPSRSRANSPGDRFRELLQLCLWVPPLIQTLIPPTYTVFLFLSPSILAQQLSICSAVSRLAGMDQAIHKMNVGHYTLDVKVSQLLDRLSRMDGKTIICCFSLSSIGWSLFIWSTGCQYLPLSTTLFTFE